MNISNINYGATLSKRRSFNILIIDDDENIGASLKEYLECRGHEVTVVDECARGITHLYMKHFDIVFLDYHLDTTCIDGAGVTKCVKDFDATKKSIIFAYTGDSSNEAIYNFKASGMDGVIFKPIDVRVLDKMMLSLESKVELDKSFLDKLSRQYNRSFMVFATKQ